MRGALNKEIDWITIGVFVFLVFFGWLSIYAAVFDPSAPLPIFSSQHHAGNQFMWLLLSFGVAFVIMFVDFRLIFVLSYPTYIITMLALLGVLFFGIEVNGAKAWFQFFGIRVMPAEFSKVAIALALAKYMDSKKFKFGINVDTAAFFGLLMVPALIILKQNETGTVLVLGSTILVMYRFGMNFLIPLVGIIIAFLFILTLSFYTYEKDYWPIYVGIGALGGTAIFLFRKRREFLVISALSIVLCAGIVKGSVYFFDSVLQDHQRKRLISLIDPEKDPRGSGYQSIKSKTAIASGGLSGKGYLNGDLTQLEFVPEQHTDFIFTTIGEERGFWGTTFFILLYSAFMVRLIMLAERQRSNFAKAYGYVMIGIILFHFIINIGMTIGLAPVIGIPLPFFSKGGSSLLAFTIMLFTFLKLDMHRSQILARS